MLVPFFALDPDRALNSSKQVKDDGIVIVGLGISPVNKEMLQKIVSSQDQVVIFPRFEPDSPVKENTTSEVTAMLCEGIYKIQEILRARSLVDRCVYMRVCLTVFPRTYLENLACHL